MKKILVIQPIHKAGIELLKNNSNYEFEVVENIDPEFLKSKIKDCDAASIRTAKLTGDVIEAANNLKIISRHGVETYHSTKTYQPKRGRDIFCPI